MTYSELAGIWHITDDDRVTRCGEPVTGPTYRWQQPPVPLCWRCDEAD